MLKVDGMNVYYGNIHAIKDISFEVNQGEIVTLIGANGAGKSTILKTISGLLRPKTGTVSFLEEPIQSIAPHKIVLKGLAQVPEGRRVFTQLTVEENLEMGGYTRKKSEVAPDLAHVYDLFPRLKERRRQTEKILDAAFCKENCPQCRISKFNVLFAKLFAVKSKHFI